MISNLVLLQWYVPDKFKLLDGHYIITNVVHIGAFHKKIFASFYF